MENIIRMLDSIHTSQVVRFLLMSLSPFFSMCTYLERNLNSNNIWRKIKSVLFCLLCLPGSHLFCPPFLLGRKELSKRIRLMYMLLHWNWYFIKYNQLSAELSPKCFIYILEGKKMLFLRIWCICLRDLRLDNC